MKKIIWYSRLLLMTGTSVWMGGCINDDGDSVDVTAPVIEVITPQAGTHLPAGSFIPFDAIFSDDLELGSYSIDIHDSFDGHDHGRIMQVNDDPSLVLFTLKRNYNFPEGLMMYNASHDEMEIPVNSMAGPYHFIVQAVDKAGNATSYQDGSTKELEIIITNSSQSIVTITNLVNGELEIEAGVVFMVTGDVSDPTIGDYEGIHSMQIALGESHEESDDHDHMRVAQDDHETLFNEVYEGEALASFMTDGVVILDQVFESLDFMLTEQQLSDLISAGTDHLELLISVIDEQGNVTLSYTPVHIHMD